MHQPTNRAQLGLLGSASDFCALPMQGVLRLMGNYDASWGSMKKFLAGAGMVQRILNFDIRSIDAETRRDVRRWVEQKANSFDQQVIYRVSVAAAPLAKWVIAVMQYSQVLEKIAPMEARLNAATNALAGVQGRLNECREQLMQIDHDVGQMQLEYETLTKEASMLQIDLERAQSTL